MPSILLVSLAPIMIVGTVFLLMPRVRAGILFGVSVPVEFTKSAEGQAILGRYQTHVLIVLFLVMVACGAVVLNGMPVVSIAVTIAEFPLLCWAWVRAWHQTRLRRTLVRRNAAVDRDHPGGCTSFRLRVAKATSPQHGSRSCHTPPSTGCACAAIPPLSHRACPRSSRRHSPRSRPAASVIVPSLPY